MDPVGVSVEKTCKWVDGGWEMVPDTEIREGDIVRMADTGTFQVFRAGNILNIWPCPDPSEEALDG